MKMRRIISAICLAAAFTAVNACSDDDDDAAPALSAKDQTIMEQASYGNIAEVELGLVADSISPTIEVKEFGQMMILDHTTAQQDLEKLAISWSVTIPRAPDSLHAAKKQQLMMMSGHMFDTAYINGQIKDHEATIALLEMAVDESDQQAIKDYANKYLPQVRMHLEHAQMIATELNQ
jgi:putative membrane protein